MTTTKREVDLTATVPLLKEWRAAVAAMEAATAREKELRGQYKSTLVALGAEAGYLLDENGIRRPVVSCKTTASFRGAEFKKTRPDLWEQFRYLKEVETLDVDALKKQFPEVHRAFQTTAIRPDWKAVDNILGAE
jgi:hypothetical protein